MDIFWSIRYSTITQGKHMLTHLNNSSNLSQGSGWKLKKHLKPPPIRQVWFQCKYSADSACRTCGSSKFTSLTEAHSWRKKLKLCWAFSKFTKLERFHKTPRKKSNKNHHGQCEFGKKLDVNVFCLTCLIKLLATLIVSLDHTENNWAWAWCLHFFRECFGENAHHWRNKYV